jgi:hypothetical protein
VGSFECGGGILSKPAFLLLLAMVLMAYKLSIFFRVFPLFKWADIDLAPRGHVEKGIQGERRSIVSDCFALAMKVDHYNAKHLDEEPLQVIFNFEEDIEEMKIAKGIEEDDAA